MEKPITTIVSREKAEYAKLTGRCRETGRLIHAPTTAMQEATAINAMLKIVAGNNPRPAHFNVVQCNYNCGGVHLINPDDTNNKVV